MRGALLVLALLSPASQDKDERIRDLIDKLSDDFIDKRDDAMRDLTTIGEPAIPLLKKLVEGPEGENRARAVKILADIEKQRRLKGILKTPKLFSVQAENRSVRELLQELRKATDNDVDAAAVPEEAKATVCLKDVSFYEALDAICKSNGRIMWRIGARVKIAAEKYVEYPRKFRSGYMIWISRVESRDRKSFGNDSNYSYANVQINVAWEKGNRPTRFGLRGRALRDDKGNELFDPNSAGYTNSPAGDDYDQLSYSLSLYASKPLDSDSKALALVDAELQVEYVVSHSTLTISDPASHVNAPEKNEKLTATIVRFTRKDGRVYCDLTIAGARIGDSSWDTNDIVLADKSGKKYRGTYSGSSSDGRQTTYYLRFPVADEVELKCVTLRVPNEIHAETLDATFKNVDLK